MASKSTLRKRVRRLRKRVKAMQLTIDAQAVEMRSAHAIINDKTREVRAISTRAGAAMTAVDDIATAVARATQEMGKALRDARLNITTAQPPT